jgi:hypothetical protein
VSCAWSWHRCRVLWLGIVSDQEHTLKVVSCLTLHVTRAVFDVWFHAGVYHSACCIWSVDSG